MGRTLKISEGQSTDTVYLIQTLDKDDLRKKTFNKNQFMIETCQKFLAVNGYNKQETVDEFKKLNIKLHGCTNDDYRRYGVLASNISKIKALKHGIEIGYKQFGIIEDDVLFKDTFHRVNTMSMNRFLYSKNEDLDFIKLGRSGEGYLFSYASARKCLSKIEENGIMISDSYFINDTNIYDYITCGSLLWKLVVPETQGDCLKTDYIEDEVFEELCQLN